MGRYIEGTIWVPALLLAASLLACGACQARGPSEQVEAKTPSAPIQWRAIGTWSGRGNTQTGSFTVETGALRLRWETRHETAPGAGTFRVLLHSAISGRPLQVIVDHAGIGGDTSFLQDDPRVSYLVIESTNLEWTATLEEVVQGSPVP